MHKLDHTQIDSLTQYEGEPILSIYIPTHLYPTPPNIQEDQIRFKNCIRDGCEQWAKVGDEKKVHSIQQQLEATLEDLTFWQQTTQGLAVFASYDEVHYISLPIECEAHVFVGPIYDTAPLLAMAAYNQPYYLLALALHNSKLFYGDRYGLGPVEIDFPASPEDALNIDEMFANSQTVRNQDSSSGAHMFTGSHGPGDSNNAGQQERLEYFRILDNLIMEADDIDTSLPILLSAAEGDIADYKDQSHLPHLVASSLPGNYTIAHLQDLQTIAWPLIEKDVVEARFTQATEHFQELKSAGKALSNEAEIRSAATEGKIDTLFICLFAMSSDTVSDGKTDRLLLRFPDEYDKANIPALAREVCQKGGAIIGLTPEAMPDGAQLAAMTRY